MLLLRPSIEEKMKREKVAIESQEKERMQSERRNDDER